MRFHVAVLAFAGAMTLAGAQARDLDGRYAASDMHDWYMSQRNQVGQVCCDEADGRPADDWGHGPKGYWVAFDGKRHDVPAQALVNGAHPQGLAVVWVYPVGTEIVRCFLPGMEG